jgi:hypothetical protein
MVERSELVVELTLWLYRVDGFFLASIIEDPAWLAFAFC